MVVGAVGPDLGGVAVRVTGVRMRTRRVSRQLTVFSLAALLTGCLALDLRDAADRAGDEPEHARLFERAERGDGAGRVPEVTGDCRADLTSIERVREVFAESDDGLAGYEQVALRQLVEATRDCPNRSR